MSLVNWNLLQVVMLCLICRENVTTQHDLLTYIDFNPKTSEKSRRRFFYVCNIGFNLNYYRLLMFQ